MIYNSCETGRRGDVEKNSVNQIKTEKRHCLELITPLLTVCILVCNVLLVVFSFLNFFYK